MNLLPSRNVPTARSQCPKHLVAMHQQRGHNAPFLDGMPNFGDIDFQDLFTIYVIKS